MSRIVSCAGGAKLPEPAKHYFGEVEPFGNELVPLRIGGSAEEVKGEIFKDTKVKRFPFVPLKSARRFIVVRGYIEADEFQAASLVHPFVPAADSGATADYLFNNESFTHDTRREAFDTAAAANLAELTGKQTHYLIHWRAVAEFGEVTPVSNLLIHIDKGNTVGCASRDLEYPVRLVYPDAEEMARYPMPPVDAIGELVQRKKKAEPELVGTAKGGDA